MKGKDSEKGGEVPPASQEPKGFVKMEVNCLTRPVGTLSKHFKGKVLEASWVHPEHGPQVWKVAATEMTNLPGPSARQLFNALQKLIHDATKDGKPPAFIATTYYQLANLLKLSICKSAFDQIRRDLRDLAGVKIFAENTFRVKGVRKPRSKIFSILSVRFEGDTLPQTQTEILGKPIADQIYVFLDPVFLDSLAESFTKKIDFDFILQLENATLGEMYKLLAFGFQTKMLTEPGGPHINYNYHEFCQRLALKIQPKRYVAKGSLVGFFKSLVEAAYIERFEFGFDGDEQERWFIRFWPGARARAELDLIEDQRTLFDNSPPLPAAPPRPKTKEDKELERIEADKADAEDEAILATIKTWPPEMQETLKQEATENVKRNFKVFTGTNIDIEMVRLCKERQQNESATPATV